MITFIFQAICVYLFVVGALFCMVELRTGFDRTFLYAGITILLASLFSSIDIWFLHYKGSLVSMLYWTRIQHIIATSQIPVFILLISSLSKKTFRSMRLIIFIVIVTVILLLTNLLMRIDHNTVQTTFLYDLVFIPLVLFSMFFLVRLLINGIRKHENSENKILIANLVGLVTLFLCGIFDLISFAFEGNTLFPIRSATVLGLLAFAVMYSILFSERLLLIINDRKAAYAKLITAFKDLEEVNSLKKLGEASAMINHEIGNYLFIISTQAQLLKEFCTLSPDGQKHVDNIFLTVERLRSFSQDILDLSKSQIIKNKKPIRVSEVIKYCIHAHFEKSADAFTLDIPENEPVIYGDWGKLEQVFRNLFKNSFDAAVSGRIHIRVKILINAGVMLILVEDDGIGCTKDQLDSIFKAFYSTKQANKGTGLGMTITSTIIQAHGGNISAYSKNLENHGKHGLKLQIAIPIYEETDPNKKIEKSRIILVKTGISDLGKILTVFRNVNVNPFVVQDVDSLSQDQFELSSYKILIHTKALAIKLPDKLDSGRLHILSEYGGSIYVLAGSQTSEPETFSEEYVICRLV